MWYVNRKVVVKTEPILDPIRASTLAFTAAPTQATYQNTT